MKNGLWRDRAVFISGVHGDGGWLAGIFWKLAAFADRRSDTCLSVETWSVKPDHAGLNYCVIGDLGTSDRVMNQAFGLVRIRTHAGAIGHVLESINAIALKGVLTDAARK